MYSLGFEEPEGGEGSSNAAVGACGSRAAVTAEGRLKAKLSKESSDGNLVKINLKKKTFVRGKKTMTGAKYRRMEWKRKTLAKEGKQAKVVCFRCKEEGHWAR